MIGEKIGDTIGEEVKDIIPEAIVFDVPKVEKIADATTYVKKAKKIKHRIEDARDNVKQHFDEDNILNQTPLGFDGYADEDTSKTRN